MNPSFFLFMGAVNAMGQMSAGRAQADLYNRQAQQYEFDADMQRLRGLQEGNALTDKFNIYIRTANAQRAKQNRSSNDRSINAMMDKARRSNQEESARSLLQNLASAQQSRGRADISRMEGRVAQQTSFLNGINSLSSGFYQYSTLSP